MSEMEGIVLPLWEIGVVGVLKFAAPVPFELIRLEATGATSGTDAGITFAGGLTSRMDDFDTSRPPSSLSEGLL